MYLDIRMWKEKKRYKDVRNAVNSGMYDQEKEPVLEAAKAVVKAHVDEYEAKIKNKRGGFVGLLKLMIEIFVFAMIAALVGSLIASLVSNGKLTVHWVMPGLLQGVVMTICLFIISCFVYFILIPKRRAILLTKYDNTLVVNFEEDDENNLEFLRVKVVKSIGYLFSAYFIVEDVESGETFAVGPCDRRFKNDRIQEGEIVTYVARVEDDRFVAEVLVKDSWAE